MISYRNKSKIIPSTKDIIGLLIEENIDFILVGSQVGKYYGIYDRPRDIDFLISDSSSNISKLFLLLQQFFNLQNIDEILNMDIINLIPKEKIPIQLFKYKPNKNCDCLISSQEYNKLKKNSILINFYNYHIDAVSLKDYIDCMVFVTNCLELQTMETNNFSSVVKTNKYKKIINNYKDKYEHIHEFMDKT